MRHRPGCFKFPYYNSVLLVHQPDYKRWKSVEIGMGRNEVVALLGRPLRDPYLSPQPTYSVYGYLQMPMMPHIRTYRFYVRYDDDWRVAGKADPFGGIFSVNGRPSKPLILSPPPRAVFGHYPRIVDIRWHPASGEYPIWYEVEMGHGRPFTSDAGEFHDEICETECPFPYYVTEFGGDQPGRLRVRGVNALGKGAWSDYRYFDFTPRPPAQD
jgi:hypothetical protein